MILECWETASEAMDKWEDPTFCKKAKGRTGVGPRTASKACGDARFMLNLARLENHFRHHKLIEKGEIVLADEGELQELEERLAAGEVMPPSPSFLGEPGWKQELEWMNIIKCEIIHKPLSCNQLKLIMKRLPAVTRSSLLCNLGSDLPLG